jgi:hypothetical protein
MTETIEAAGVREALCGPDLLFWTSLPWGGCGSTACDVEADPGVGRARKSVLLTTHYLEEAEGAAY